MKIFIFKASLKRVLIAFIIISAFTFTYNPQKEEFNNRLLHLIAKRKAESDVYNYSNFVRNNVMKYRNRTLTKQNPDDRPFVRMKSWYRIAPAYKLSGCIVEKSMCTVIQGIFCYLFDSDKFIAANISITADDWNKRFCFEKNEVPSTEMKNKLMSYPTETIFIVRDPLQRFLSGFVDKCIQNDDAWYVFWPAITDSHQEQRHLTTGFFGEKSRCYGCEGSVLCAIEQLHAELMKFSFQYYLMGSKRQTFDFSYEAQHMAPQTWYCDLFHEAPTHVFIRYGEKGMDQERMVSNLLEVFKEHGVEEEKREYIRKSLTKNTQHTTKNSPIRQRLADQIKASQKHLDLFMQIFRHDYEMFGFEPVVNTS